jgi:hypothetical protein
MRHPKRKTFSFLLGAVCLLVAMGALLYSVSSSNKVELASQSSNENALDFAVTLDKKSYKLNEPIQATFKLKNIGVDPVLVNSRLALNWSSAPHEVMDIYCEITRQNGDPIRFSARVSVVTLRSSHFVQLKSGDTIETVINDLHDLYHIREPAEYSIRAFYVNTFDPDNGQVAWKGEVVSESQTFVIEP